MGRKLFLKGFLKGVPFDRGTGGVGGGSCGWRSVAARGHVQQGGEQKARDLPHPAVPDFEVSGRCLGVSLCAEFHDPKKLIFQRCSGCKIGGR